MGTRRLFEPGASYSGPLNKTSLKFSGVSMLTIAQTRKHTVPNCYHCIRKIEKRKEYLTMKICGLQKTTLLDFPGHVAATIFTGGCNFRCPFCHNSGLLPSWTPKVYSDEEILDFLKKRRGILEGVCISGGEPSLQPDL